MVISLSDWKVSTLGNIGTFTKGAPLSKADISETGTPFVLYGELYTTYNEVTYKIYRHTKRSVDSLYYSNIGDVIIPTSGETAEEIATACCIMVPGAILAGDLNIYRANGFDGRYVSYVINHIVNRQIADVAQGISIIHVNAKELKKIEIHYPELPEQKAIANTLDTFDTHIANLAELIEKKKAIRDGALEDLVSGKIRLARFSKRWYTTTINDVTQDIITGGTPSTSHPEYWGGNIPWLASTEIHQKMLSKETTCITELGLTNSSAKIAPKNSVLIALAGQGKTRGTAAFLLRPMALNQSLAALVSNEKLSSKFLFFLMECMYLPLRELSSGDGGRGGLNKKLLKSISINIPTDLKEQGAIADVLTAMDDEIKAIEDERDKMIQIREGAMDDLLTGRVRLRA